MIFIVVFVFAADFMLKTGSKSLKMDLIKESFELIPLQYLNLELKLLNFFESPMVELVHSLGGSIVQL